MERLLPTDIPTVRGDPKLNAVVDRFIKAEGAAASLIQFGRNVNIDLDEKFHGRERSNRCKPPYATASSHPDRKGT